MEQKELEQVCKNVRRDIINMTADASSGHPGGSLSAVEIMTALFFEKMNINPQEPKWEGRDRFVLSKGHAAPCYYAVLGERGYFDKNEFKNFRQLHSILQGHPDTKKCPGVDASTGSLGQGISIAVGMALGEKKLQNSTVQVYTLLGDGELQEGQVWEASMAAAHYGLDNFTVIVDHKGLQIDGTNDQVMGLGDLAGKFKAFGFNVLEIDGNNLSDVLKALDAPFWGKPKCIIANTIKGKGISFMENQVGWHGKAPSEEERCKALKELEEAV